MELGGTVDKRAFLEALPCATRGWFAFRAPSEELTPADEWNFHCGNQVGEAARAQLGAGLMLPRAPLRTAVETTRQIVALPATGLLFEASVQWGAFVARADALRRGDGGWELIEVKSAKEPDNGKVESKHVDDLAYTLMVARGAGVPVARCVLLLLSRSYRLGEATPLFVEFDITDAVELRAAEFANIAPELASLILGEARPTPVLKAACGGCAYFTNDCLGRAVATSIFVIPRLGEKRIDGIRPIVDLFQLPADINLTEIQRRVFEVIRSGDARIMPGLARLDAVVWPAYYLDFETVAPFLPWFAGDGVHEVHPFQYSIHRRDEPAAPLDHREFLAPLDGDWRRDFAERLLADLGTSGSIVVYTDFEARQLRAMAAALPDLAERIDAVIARLYDLHDVVKDGYCHPGFRGRTSIKNVFPALVPGPGYSGLAIAEGLSASGVFGLMRVGRYDADSSDAYRRHLLEYCKLDTLAMVQVHDALLQLRGGSTSLLRDS